MGFLSQKKPVFMQSSVELTMEGYKHLKEEYCLNDVVGDLGGVFDVFVVVVGFLISPIARHIFVIQVMQKKYKVV